jgi:hypothetical protein
MATFVPGYLYANRDSISYGAPRKRATQNKQQPGTQEIDWLCRSVTKTFAVFRDHLAVVQRRKIYRDNIGSFVYPFGRYSGAPVLRAENSYNNGTLQPDDDYSQDNDNGPSDG